MAVKRSRANGEGVRSSKKVLGTGQAWMGVIVVTAWWGDGGSVPGGTGRRMLKNPGSSKRGHGDVLLDRVEWEARCSTA